MARRIRSATVVNVHEAKTHLSRLLDRVAQGEEIVLAKAGKPYARLVPLDASPKREPGLLRGRIEMDDSFFDELPEEELRAWEGADDEERV
jgi:prevent-host-death family protein